MQGQTLYRNLEPSLPILLFFVPLNLDGDETLRIPGLFDKTLWHHDCSARSIDSGRGAIAA
jgi:hypothetical protein